MSVSEVKSSGEIRSLQGGKRSREICFRKVMNTLSSPPGTSRLGLLDTPRDGAIRSHQTRDL